MKQIYVLITCCIIVLACSRDDGESGALDLTACFEISKPTVSVGEDLQISNCSTGATLFAYSFGNGEESNEEHPLVSYDQSGEFTIMLTVTNDLQESMTYTQIVQVLAAESSFVFPEMAPGFIGFPMETGVNPTNGLIYYIELSEDTMGSGGSKFYYRELDASYNFTSNYIADKPYNSNSAFVNFYPSGKKNFVFSRTLPGLYGTQEVTYDSNWGSVVGNNSATKHSYGFLPNGSNFLYYGTQVDNGYYKGAVETRNSTGDAFQIDLVPLGVSDSMIGDLIKVGSNYIAYGAEFSKNTTEPRISDFKPTLVFLDGSLNVTSQVVYEDSVLDSKITSADDLNGTYHLEQLTNGNLVMYGNGELIVADATGAKITSFYFDGSSNNQALISLGNSFILSSKNYLRKFNAEGTELKQLKYDGNYLPEILEINDTLFFIAGYEIEGQIKLLYGSTDTNLNLINLNQ